MAFSCHDTSSRVRNSLTWLEKRVVAHKSYDNVIPSSQMHSKLFLTSCVTSSKWMFFANHCKNNRKYQFLFIDHLLSLGHYTNGKKIEERSEHTFRFISCTLWGVGVQFTLIDCIIGWEKKGIKKAICSSVRQWRTLHLYGFNIGKNLIESIPKMKRQNFALFSRKHTTHQTFFRLCE